MLLASDEFCRAFRDRILATRELLHVADRVAEGYPTDITIFEVQDRVDRASELLDRAVASEVRQKLLQ